MTGDQTAQLAAATLMLVLVASSLLSRRLPLGQAALMVAGWLLIFGVLFIGYSYREELSGVFRRVSGDLLAGQSQTTGGALRVPMSDDGHFWVTGEINGRSVRFLIDSGATTTAVSAATAAAAGLEVDGGLPVIIDTANGTVRAQRARIGELAIGPIHARDLPVVVSPAFGDTNVIGMNFLSSLASWRVEGRALILQPQSTADKL